VIILVVVGAAMAAWRLAVREGIEGVQVVGLFIFGGLMVLVPLALGCDAEDVFLLAEEPSYCPFAVLGYASLVMGLVAAIGWVIDVRRR
jgi:hypothetical protein